MDITSHLALPVPIFWGARYQGRIPAFLPEESVTQTVKMSKAYRELTIVFEMMFYLKIAWMCRDRIHFTSKCETDSSEIGPAGKALPAASHVIVFNAGHQLEIMTVEVVDACKSGVLVGINE